ncbi:type II toxin-antitoxin system PemK/MazF family toxin [Mycobacterium riyadhense]|nr:type II toxin-antitoxin system PemK/MazF family toxin [Mycobacterium riyadhense]
MRSQTYHVDLGHGAKPWVVLSNNSRNRNLDTVLAARITTTSTNAHVPTVVPLTDADPLVGFVLVDDIVQLYHDELTESLGILSPPTMQEISRALRDSTPLNAQSGGAVRPQKHRNRGMSDYHYDAFPAQLEGVTGK